MEAQPCAKPPCWCRAWPPQPCQYRGVQPVHTHHSAPSVQLSGLRSGPTLQKDQAASWHVVWLFCGSNPPAQLHFAPPGAVITHANFIANSAGAVPLVDLNPGDCYISYLPLAHIYERVMQVRGCGRNLKKPASAWRLAWWRLSDGYAIPRNCSLLLSGNAQLPQDRLDPKQKS